MEKESLFVGIGRMHLNFRYARSLKDKRHSLKSIKQKLRNQGFSVSECGFLDNPKRSTVGFVIAGNSSADVEKQMQSAESLFIGEMEVVQRDRDILDYGFEKEEGTLGDMFFDEEEEEEGF